jgi:putative endonuclease
MYILKCDDGTYYTGSTWHIEQRFEEHYSGAGANYTARRLRVVLLFFEYYERIDEAFYREKQVQGWTRRKKEALINGQKELLPVLAKKIWKKELKYDNQ